MTIASHYIRGKAAPVSISGTGTMGLIEGTESANPHIDISEYKTDDISTQMTPVLNTPVIGWT